VLDPFNCRSPPDKRIDVPVKFATLAEYVGPFFSAKLKEADTTVPEVVLYISVPVEVNPGTRVELCTQSNVSNEA